MRISISDKKQATKLMLLDMFSERVKKFEKKMQEQLSRAYLSEFVSQMDWYDKTSEDLKPLIKTRVNVKLGIKENDCTTLIHPKIVAYIGDKPERYWDKYNPVCIPFGEFKRSMSSYDFGSIELLRTVPKVTSDYYYAESGKLKTLIKKLMKEKRELESLIESAGNQFYSALLTISTDKKLQELLPDAVKYMPTKEPANPCRDIVPTELYKSVAALLSCK